MKSTSTWWKILLSGLLLAGTLVANADTYQPSYSTAGFYQLSNTGRTVYNMNPACVGKAISKERNSRGSMTKTGTSYHCPTA